VDGLVATLCGVVENLPRSTRVEARVINCGIHTDTRHRLVRLVATRLPAVTLTFLALETDVLARMPFPAGLRHANRSVYARLFLPELLPDLDRVIYLDCDLLVDRDISALANVPLNGAVVAAALDQEQSTSDGVPQFNSGVMVMDLRAMRETRLSQRAVASAAERNPRHGDQTLLNELLLNQWARLDPSWNRQVFLLPTFSIFRDEPASIWHIYMGRKPWHFHREGARGLVAEYYATLERIGWVATFTPELHLNAPRGRDRTKRLLAALRRWTRQLA
jgi:lipopolysaccharide biosynthesis glycosyltransferase